MPQSPKYDVVVLGGGSGGFGAALAAGRRGLNVLLVEKGPVLGGTSTRGGVNTWEPGVSGPGFPAELYDRLSSQPSFIGGSRTDKFYSSDRPWGYSKIDRSIGYRDTLRRSGLDSDQWFRITFEPDAMAAEMARMLAETQCVEIRLNNELVDAVADNRAVQHVVLRSGDEETSVEACYFVDATGGIALCRILGCRTAIGAESRDVYDEPGAPAEDSDFVNGVTLCYRVTPCGSSEPDPLPETVGEKPYKAVVSINEYPCGDLNLNMLPTMEGREFRSLERFEALRICRDRVYRHWFWLQTEHNFTGYRLANIFEMAGIREGPRLVARTVLTENEIRRGCSGQMDPERWIALADHALDVHGEGGGATELEEPYGIPYDCLLPQEYDNLIVACRGAGFSHIAASSCRLSRTMIGLGHAAGLATALASDDQTLLPEMKPEILQDWLQKDNVAIDPKDLRLRIPES
ncbi:MAG: FAD-dependent oxidoreductase [Planctomycetes bacterium]|nr:FAD-dependent oxidoreductase [Planctomycetota bacterium]